MIAMCRIEWCGLELDNSGPYSFGDGKGNIYRKCTRGHWTPEPPPANGFDIEDFCDEDD